MPDQPLAMVLRSALIAGLLAGLLVAAFHFVATEPVIDQAVELEEQLRAAEEPEEEPVVSRETQRVGLFIGFLLYGLVWAVLFGAVYHLTRHPLAGLSTAQRGLALALAAYWAVALFPAIKYPPNPPGVGEPETIVYRQALYLAVLGLSVAGTVVVGALVRSAPGRWPLAAAFLAVFFGGVYLIVPGNPDPMLMPADLVTQFRLLSVVGLTLFWAALGLIFSFLLSRRSAPGLRLRASEGSAQT